MPVIQIHALMPPEVERVDMCLSAAIEGVAGALGCAPDAVWAQFSVVEAMHTGPRPRRFNGHCPVVVVRAMPGRPDAAVRRALAALASGVAAALDLPVEDVWVQWETVQPGRVFAGGAVRDAPSLP